ncbi:MAG: 16S rRNA (cytosine(1402)-N(4))-methyltransferase RsmH [Gemmatimonadaceae bacterium]|nr:16S rRNA (cytosine(1402)-N(4))-methyltransferase RsmH [Gemmatimonadaceae bacterium]
MTGDGRFDSEYHTPVMVGDVVRLLAGGHGNAPRILDCTLGGGGHAAALLDAGAVVTGLDQDPEAVAAAAARLRQFVESGRFRALRVNFADFAGASANPDGEQGAAATGAEAEGIPGATLLFDGILLDLGVSSHQIDVQSRGFSFRPGTPLGMRMDGQGPSAAEYLNGASREEMAAAFKDFGDERKALRLAAEVVRRRETRPFVIADDLVGAIRAVLGARSGPADFARIFQAVRIAVNDEIGSLARALPLLRDRLASSGVLVVITYHSGEDRLVKHAFRDWSRSCICPPRQPVCTCGGNNALGSVVTRGGITATADEILRNARARSARLRAWRRTSATPDRVD